MEQDRCYDPFEHSLAAMPAPAAGEPGRKKRRRGTRALTALVCAVLILALSFGSVTLYHWMDGRAIHLSGNPVTFHPVSVDDSQALSVPEIYQKAVPWVVSLTSQIAASSAPTSQPQTGSTVAYGTGIMMSADGMVLTNAHVVEGATAITVTTSSGNSYPGVIVGSDANTDIAVVKIDAAGLDSAVFGNSDELIVGETAIAVGNPLGRNFADTLTAGVISATERTLTLNNYIMTLIQMDAAVNSGNSGGPLLNSRGQVVGVVNAKITEDNVEGIGFAIPINRALTVAQDLIQYGYVKDRPWLGITVQSVTQSQSVQYGLPVGVTITDVQTGSCAAAAGLQVGDRILAFNGVGVTSSAVLNYAKERCAIGDKAVLVIERDGRQQEVSCILTGRPGD